ncbi:6-bladed beta-propeller [Parabacteroides sp. AF17-28]|mgnify:FL=1|uniref:6-bladed beta-propeller n=1 Tax=Parabacteroides sp. AF17-28 TaxID=2292241 RepID=UPI000EFF831F|nr:6-bladed beta-propeller [Parabacteroides sp. AF17-28]RHR58869.1 6-bladed beta-propeller [Parabacteroides sp. AF17-28]
MKTIYPFILFLLALCACSSQKDGTEIYQTKRDNKINVRDRIKEIDMGDVLISRYSGPSILDQYLIIGDYWTKDTVVFIFDKNNFRHICSTALKGPGPDEITNFGSVGINEKKREFYLTDHGKKKIFTYSLDSVLADPQNYTHTVKADLGDYIPMRYIYVNDTLSYGTFMWPQPGRPFDVTIAKWNMVTGATTPLNYINPEIKRVRASFAVSLEQNVIVECFSHNDLMTILDLDGNLKYNVYGPDWDNEVSNRRDFFNDVLIAGDKIIAITSLGGSHSSKEALTTTLFVFDLRGKYLQTLEIGYDIEGFCYDKDNNRLIFCFNDEIQYGYLDLKGLI